MSEFQDYIRLHATDDPAALRLAAAGKSFSFDIEAAITQIEARRKFGKKLAATLAAFPEFYIPSMLAGEQSTSDALAQYHASLITPGSKVVDLTSGLGLDTLHMASTAASVVAVDQNPALAKALEFNALGLNISNIKVVCADCRSLVSHWSSSDCSEFFDAAFIDPARRDLSGSRVFSFSDCEPDVSAMLPQLRKICRKLIIKASPMLDVAAAVRSLGIIPECVIALGTPNECKELIFCIDFTAEFSEPVLKAVSITPKGSQSFEFTRSEELSAPTPSQQPALKPDDCIYEPSPAIMKMAPFRLLAHRFNLCGFSSGTNLFYSQSSDIQNFPGRRFKVLEVLPYSSSVTKRLARRYPIAQVATRNFSISAEDLRRKLSVREGANPVRIFGLSNNSSQLLVITQFLKTTV